MITPHVRRLLRISLVIANTAVAIITISAAYGGRVDPAASTIPAIIAMTFPGFLFLSFMLLAVSFFTARRTALIPLAAIIISFPAIKTFYPLNLSIPPLTDYERCHSFTFISYNDLYFRDWRKEREPFDQERWQRETEAGAVNPTMSFILSEKPDIACFQEHPPCHAPIPAINFTEAQVDSMASMLPNSTFKDCESVFSRFPLKPIEMRQPESQYSAFCAAEVDIFGQKTLVVSIHLESIGLTDDDKALYKELTDGETKTRSDLKKIKSQLLSKLSHAFRNRAIQAKLLREQIDSLNYENVIIAGDFNDIPGCYALRHILGKDFKTAFSTAGKWSQPTYHANRFYFHIDHILYRGNLRAISYRRPTPPYSDHYPIVVGFTVPLPEDTPQS